MNVSSQHEWRSILGIAQDFADLILQTDLARFLMVTISVPKYGIAECIVWRNGQSGPFLSLEVNMNRERDKYITINHSALGVWHFGSDAEEVESARLFFNETLWENAPRA